MKCACAIFSSVTSQALQYFFTSHKRNDFRKKKVTEQKMCDSILFTLLSKTFFILSRIERDIFINALTSSCKVPVILVRF